MVHAAQIELFLLAAGTWVPTAEICARFDIQERALRAAGEKPGLLDAFAVSSTKNGQHGFCHHRFVERTDWLKTKHRLRRHAIAELRKVRAWDRARQNCLTGRRPELVEKHTGQLVMFAA